MRLGSVRVILSQAADGPVAAKRTEPREALHKMLDKVVDPIQAEPCWTAVLR